MVNEKRFDKAQNRRVKNRRGLPYVPGFQGRTGDVRNNKKYRKLELLAYMTLI